MKLLVLYEELAWYFINCMNVVAEQHDFKVLIICRRPNDNAPFRFNYVHPNITIETREQFSGEQLLAHCRSFAPNGIFMGGWAHKPYLALLKKLKPGTTVIGFDNQWSGSLKQRLGALYFRAFIKPHVQFAFVSGTPQYHFARKLGFSENAITTGAYCCDHKLFDTYYREFKNKKTQQFPKRFLFVGRYAPEKGVQDLWDSFIEWQKERPNEWELWCLGKGELVPPTHEKIKHFGFVQPEAMGPVIANAGVFILPSTFEPWGVVVHEYAAAGFPLLCSDKTGAAETFVEEGKNGFIFKAGSKEQLKEKMNRFNTLNQADLTAMSEKSSHMAARITPLVWAGRLAKMYKNEK